MAAENEKDLFKFDRLIKWALSHSIDKYGLNLESSLDFDDLVQTTYLRLLSTLNRREWPEHMPSYVVKSARRVITDYIRERSRDKNKFCNDAFEMLGLINKNRKRRLERATSAEDRELARSQSL